MNKQPKQKSNRQGSVYIAVSGTAMLVSLIGFTAIHLSRLELRSANAHNERAYARQLAYSGVEFALAAIDLDSSWRTNYTHGVENTRNPMGLTENITFRFLDNTDSNLANDATEPVEIQGIGRCGGATFVYSVAYAASVTTADQVGPLVLRKFTTGSVTGDVALSSTSWVGQYFLPNLPAEAISWTVLSIEVFATSSGAITETFDVSLHLPDGALKPGTLLETVNIVESQLPSGGQQWHEVNFGTVSGLDPNVGLCLALTTGTGSSAASLKFEQSGVTEPNTHFIAGGSGTWATPNTSQSLYYKINGVYTTAVGSGAFTVTPGSWQSTAAP